MAAKLKTAKQAYTAIRKIIARRSIEAGRSEYDKGVCVTAVGAASDVFEGVAVTGNASEYVNAVLAALEPFWDNYNDPDGEYTSGKASIGDVYFDVMGLVDSQGEA